MPSLIALAVLPFLAAAPDSGRGCEATPQIRRALDDFDALRGELNYRQRREAAEALLKKYPRDSHVLRCFFDSWRWDFQDREEQIRERYRAQAAANPNDPVALYTAGLALQGGNTPEAIRLLEAAAAKGPAFPWPHLALARAYTLGKFTNKEKARREVAAFFKACPASLDSTAQYQLGESGSPELQAATAKALRARLARETDPRALRSFTTVWALEFRTRPVPEHDALRKQVAEDVKRLEALNTEPDARWLDFLIGGYKQSGASKETITALEDRLLKDFPQSEQALGLLRKRWRAANPEPGVNASLEEWDKYALASAKAIQGWIAQFPRNRSLKASLFYTLSEVRQLPEAEAVRLAEEYLKTSEDSYGPDGGAMTYVAQFYLKRKIRPERALELLTAGIPLAIKEMERNNGQDWIPDDRRQKIEKYRAGQRLEHTGLLLQAYSLAGRVDEAKKLRGEVEGPVPKEPDQQAAYWWNRARLARIENRRADALAYFQRAVETRKEAPRKRRGRLEDPLLEEARVLWQDMGGSPDGFTLWAASRIRQEATEGRWERPEKTLPAFELTDLAGKTWKLANLEGKALLVNVWATWCGPCNSELPHFQKVYDKLKHRGDVAVFTLNIDDEIGLVAPFMKEKGYTFPVLPAYSFVNDLYEGGWGIPQNWLVDPKGKWQWRQMGFDSGDDNWEQDVIARLEVVRAGK